jgi:hypothetical protein
LELSLAGGTGSRKITGQEIMNASKLNVNNTPIINGTVGRVLFQGTGNVLQQSSSLFWDATNNRLGIGVTNPSQKLSIVGNNFLMFTGVSAQNMPAYIGTDSSDNFYVYSAGQGSGKSAYYGPSSGTHLRTSSGSLDLFVGNGAPILGLRLNSTGNILIGTTTDAGFKLDVNGTARVQGTTTLGDVATCLQGLRVNGGYTAFNASTILGSAAQSGNTFNFSTQYIGGATGTTNYFNFTGTLASATGGSFNVFNVQQTFSNTNSSQTFRGFYYNPNIAGLQSGTTHRAIETTTGDVIFGTTSGNVGIGTSTPVQKFHVNGVGVFGPGTAGTSYIQMSEGSVSGRLNRITFNDFDGGTSTRGGWLEIGVYNAQIRYGSYNTFFIGSSTRPYRFFMKDGTDNVIISNGTVAPTDAGYLFDVQGTARVSGALTLGNGLTFNLDGSTTRIFNSGQINYQSNVINGTQHNFTNQVGYNTGTIMTISGGGAANPSTTGNMAIQAIGGRMSFASGNATYNAVQVSTSIENTGTYNGIIRGFYYNPAVSGTGYSHFAFHSTSGRVRFEGLPTSPTGLNAGDIYNDGGILKIV